MTNAADVRTPTAPHGEVPGKPEESRQAEFRDLSEPLRHYLSFLPHALWRHVVGTVAKGEFSQLLVEGAGAFDEVWDESRKAEDHVQNRLTGTDRDKYRDRVELAMKEIMSVTVELAGRAELVEVLQRRRRFFQSIVPEVWQQTWKKTWARKIASLPARPRELPKRTGAPGKPPPPPKEGAPREKKPTTAPPAAPAATGTEAAA